MARKVFTETPQYLISIPQISYFKSFIVKIYLNVQSTSSIQACEVVGTEKSSNFSGPVAPYPPQAQKTSW